VGKDMAKLVGNMESLYGSRKGILLSVIMAKKMMEV
jgi:hypothetical protein